MSVFHPTRSYYLRQQVISYGRVERYGAITILREAACADRNGVPTLITKLADDPDQIAPGQGLKDIIIDRDFMPGDQSSGELVALQIAALTFRKDLLSNLRREGDYPASVTGSICCLSDSIKKLLAPESSEADYCLLIRRMRDKDGAPSKKLSLGFYRDEGWLGQRFEISFESLKAFTHELGGQAIARILADDGWYLGRGLATRLHELLCTLVIGAVPDMPLFRPPTFRMFTSGAPLRRGPWQPSA
jgi:hypothetical protein